MNDAVIAPAVGAFLVILGFMMIRGHRNSWDLQKNDAELAEFDRLAVSRVDAEAAGHAKMHDQHLAVVEACEQVFGTPVERIDLAAPKPLGEMLRQREAQVVPPLLYAGKAVADQDRRKPQSHRLHLRQLGHGRLPQCKTNSVAAQQ